MQSNSGSYRTAFKLRKKTSTKTRDEYLVGFWGPLKVVVVRSREATADGAELYNVIFHQTEHRQPPRLASRPTRLERARVNEPLIGRPLLPAPNDPLPF